MSAYFASESYLWREQGERGKESSELKLRNRVFFPSALRALRSTLEKGFAFKKNKSDTREIYLKTVCWSKHMLHNERRINDNCGIGLLTYVQFVKKKTITLPRINQSQRKLRGKRK